MNVRVERRPKARPKAEPKTKPQRKPRGRRTPLFLALLAVVVTLNLIGLVMVLSASSVTSQNDFGNPFHYLQRQAIWSGIGVVVLLITQRIDYHRWRRVEKFTTMMLAERCVAWLRAT